MVKKHKKGINMEIKNAEFYISVGNAKGLKDFGLDEIAFVGRSNAGKSSLINAITGKRKLAVTSSLPGRTRLINYFKINDEFFFVDLPGYGYARASKVDQAKWQQLIETYLENAKHLKCAFVLMDVRHLPSELDKMMLKYLYYKQIPFKVLATKADKLSRAQYTKQVGLIANALNLGKDDVIAVSADKKINLDMILTNIDAFMEVK